MQLYSKAFILIYLSSLVTKNNNWHIFCFIVALIELIVPILARNDSIGVRYLSI